VAAISGLQQKNAGSGQQLSALQQDSSIERGKL
jgi:hypothetical protein